MTNQEKIENIISNTEYWTYEIQNINEYNASQFEVELYDDIKEDSFLLDINLCEMTMCEIILETRQRVAHQDIKSEYYL